MSTSGSVRISYIGVGESPDVRPPARNGAWVVDNGGFRRLVDMEIQKAQRLRYCVSLVCTAADRKSPETEQPAPPALAERIAPLLRSTDVVACWALPSLALMLVDAEVTSLPLIVGSLTTRLEMLPWSARAASYPITLPDAQDRLHH